MSSNCPPWWVVDSCFGRCSTPYNLLRGHKRGSINFAPIFGTYCYLTYHSSTSRPAVTSIKSCFLTYIHQHSSRHSCSSWCVGRSGSGPVRRRGTTAKAEARQEISSCSKLAQDLVCRCCCQTVVFPNWTRRSWGDVLPYSYRETTETNSGRPFKPLESGSDNYFNR